MRPDQFSLLEPTFDRLRATPDWHQYDEEAKALKLKAAFREESSAKIWDAFEPHDESWWRRAVYTLEL